MAHRRTAHGHLQPDHPNPTATPFRSTPPALSDDHLTLMSMGRLSYEKGFDILLRAFAIVAARFPKWHLKIIGDGELRDELEQLARNLGLSDQVVFTGALSDSWKLLQRGRSIRNGLAVRRVSQRSRRGVVMRVAGDCHRLLDRFACRRSAGWRQRARPSRRRWVAGILQRIRLR